MDLRRPSLVSRVSFEPLSTLEQNGAPLSRDGSGLSVESGGAEYETWRVSLSFVQAGACQAAWRLPAHGQERNPPPSLAGSRPLA